MAEATNNQKKITIPEFKAWLDGLSEIQPDDWAPDLNQWKKIRAKIQSLEDFDTPLERQIILTIERAVHKVRMPAPPQAWYPPNPGTQVVMNPDGSVFQPQPTVAIPATVPQPLIVPDGSSSLAGASAATPALIPNIPGVSRGNLDPRNAIKIESAKTADIDTSSGSYKSNFL